MSSVVRAYYISSHPLRRRCAAAGPARPPDRCLIYCSQQFFQLVRFVFLFCFFLFFIPFWTREIERKKKEEERWGRAIQRDAYLRHVYVKMRSWSAALSLSSFFFLLLLWSRGSVTSKHLAKYAHSTSLLVLSYISKHLRDSVLLSKALSLFLVWHRSAAEAMAMTSTITKTKGANG